LQETPGAKISGLAQPMLADEGLCCRGRETGGTDNPVRRLLIVFVIGDVTGVHSMIGNQDAFQPVEYNEIEFLAEVLQELPLPFVPRQGADLVLALTAYVAKRAD
jgi:hypothetical protein